MMQTENQFKICIFCKKQILQTDIRNANAWG